MDPNAASTSAPVEIDPYIEGERLVTYNELIAETMIPNKPVVDVKLAIKSMKYHKFCAASAFGDYDSRYAVVLADAMLDMSFKFPTPRPLSVLDIRPENGSSLQLLTDALLADVTSLTVVFSRALLDSKPYSMPQRDVRHITIPNTRNIPDRVHKMT